MADTPPPSERDKIIEALSIMAQKGDGQNAAITELVRQTRESKTFLSDIIAQRSEYAADIRDLKAAIDTTRRALDPKALAEHVADNNNAFMGDLTRKFANTLNANAERDRELRDTSRTFQALAAKFTQETTFLNGLASRLEERDTRSKWDWVTLAAGMAVAALLAGGGAFFAAKANIERDDFQRSIQLIAQDDDASWCNLANGQGVRGESGTQYCAIAMPEFQMPEEEAE